MSRVLIFTGPTLSSEQIHTIAPQVEIFPPVAAGDLLRLSLKAGDLVAILDGYYFQSASVRHKEILDLLHRGVHVWGAASMGALRAADLAPFGMRGFGRIFQAYRDGEIDGDDEVAVVHTPQEMGYLQLTEALVNIRYACQEAVAEGILSADDYRLIMGIASELPFFERSYPLILKKASEQGLSQQIIAALQTFVRQEHLNMKKSDALTLVHALQSPPREGFSASFELHETSLLRKWKLSEQGIYVRNQWIAYRDLLSVYQLFGKDYPTIHYQAMLEQMAEIAQTSQCKQQSSDEKKALSACVALVAQHFSEQYGFRFDAELPQTARRWLRADEQSLPRIEQLARVSVRAGESLLWQQNMFQRIKAAGLLPVLAKIVYRSRQFHNALSERQSGLELDLLSAEKIRTWFMRRWETSEADFEFAVFDRGFRSLSEFLNAARSFYLFDKYVGVARFDGLPAASLRERSEKGLVS